MQYIGSVDFDEQPSWDTVSMRVVRALAGVVERAGVPRARLLDSWQLPAAELDAPEARVPRAHLHRLCEVALELAGDPALGLRAVERLPGGVLNPLANLALHAPTLGDALAELEEFSCLLSDAPAFRVGVQGNEVSVLHLPSLSQVPRVQRLLAEATVSALFRLVRCFSREARIERVCFEHAAPAYAGAYALKFEGLARFEQPFSGLCFDRALLELPSPYHDNELHSALRAFCTRRKARLGGSSSYARRVRDVLLRQRAPRQTDVASIAHALGLSERSLRRQLSAEGTSYETLVADALALIAKSCLVDERRTISETARKLGFASKAAFHRAFKRWTGMTPSEFRSPKVSPRPLGPPP